MMFLSVTETCKIARTSKQICTYAAQALMLHRKQDIITGNSAKYLPKLAKVCPFVQNIVLDCEYGRQPAVFCVCHANYHRGRRLCSFTQLATTEIAIHLQTLDLEVRLKDEQDQAYHILKNLPNTLPVLKNLGIEFHLLLYNFATFHYELKLSLAVKTAKHWSDIDRVRICLNFGTSKGGYIGPQQADIIELQNLRLSTLKALQLSFPRKWRYNRNALEHICNIPASLSPNLIQQLDEIYLIVIGDTPRIRKVQPFWRQFFGKFGNKFSRKTSDVFTRKEQERCKNKQRVWFLIHKICFE